MAVTIQYNGVNPFGTRTPFVSRDFVKQDVNGYISLVERLTLSGSRPRPNDGSCNADFQDYKDDIDQLRGYFHQQFKSFEILENATQIFYHPNVKIVSINIPESPFTSFYRYEIVIDCITAYQDGVIEPTDEWTTDEGADGTITITHTVSARGTGDRAYQKARDFVLSQSDGIYDEFLFLDGSEATVLLEDSVTPIVLDHKNRRYPLILRKSFSNILNGEFRMTETWVYNPEYTGSGYGVITYETSVTEADGQATVEISGDIQLARIDVGENEIVNAKITFDSIDFQAIAQAEYEANGGTYTLADVQGFSVTETPDLGTVSFSLSWSSQSEGSPYIVDTSTVSSSRIGGPTCFQYTGKVKSDNKCIADRYALVKTFFESVDWDARVAQKWAIYGTGESLTGNAKAKSVTYNPFSGEISFSVSYCADLEVECGAIEGFKYVMNFTPSIQKYSADPILRGVGYYSVQNLGFKNRKGFSISGSARRVKCFTKEAAKGEIRARVNLLMIKYFPGYNRILLSSEIEEDKTGDFYSFNFAWNANSDN